MFSVVLGVHFNAFKAEQQLHRFLGTPLSSLYQSCQAVLCSCIDIDLTSTKQQRSYVFVILLLPPSSVVCIRR
jgi:hypothetical protein